MCTYITLPMNQPGSAPQMQPKKLRFFVKALVATGRADPHQKGLDCARVLAISAFVRRPRHSSCLGVAF